MTKCRIVSAFVVMLSFALIGSGCSRGGGGESVLNTLKSLTGRADQLAATVPHSADSSELAALNAGLDDISKRLNAVPDNLSSQEVAAQNAATLARQRLEISIRHVQDQEEIPQTAATLADNHRPLTVTVDDAEWVAIRDNLQRTGEDYIKEFACEQAWSALVPEKKQKLNPPTTEWFADASAKTVAGYIDTTYEAWRATPIGRSVSWAQYGNDLFEKMTDFISQGELTAPTQAYLYYARYCLTPPMP